MMTEGGQTVHELKADPGPFQEIVDGWKRCEIRKADRDFRAGDVLWLRETKNSAREMAAGLTLEYSGRQVRVRISHVLSSTPGLNVGFVALSLDSARTLTNG